ncbi:AEL109Wp [Eremothecium gossypii ATCC 10895]|uniref:AEL109Wp n=1 Tax=Eremothecium gossypii (strain ATCC 10895 / CBS 109.51 / FGSC 9923 / NRRL Y-1056) TaxID=284811 RepID=Q757X1_EREGS|nr:AEL109Wp [Eremothecium gossypii ATCC 10895]AAS52576.2 AEL109Wp [Eremothecium gossypii ATCC 10895]AEY96878.1 FAEL109Wp [Eremothecium gossypii FDAG1]
MASPIKTKNQIDGAPTPQNTPASVLKESYLKNGNPLQTQQATTSVPQTINEEEINAALAKNPQLLATIQGKLGSLLGQDSGYIASLPRKVKDRLYALKKLQQDIFQLEKEFQLEMFQLEHKYLLKYAPLHARRAAIVKGADEPTPAEVEAGRLIEKENETPAIIDDDADEGDESDDAEDETGTPGVPGFWLTALENLPMISQTITDRDAEVLHYLANVSMEYLTEGKPGFKLLFDFAPNPFFADPVLVKTYYYQPELGYSGDFIYDHAEGTPIQWASHEANVTVVVEKRKQRNKTTKQVRTIEKLTPVESFFNFFDPPAVPPADESLDADDDDEEVVGLESRLALDYAIGEEIKDKLIPRAIDWFTGVAREFDYDDDEDSDAEGHFDDEDSDVDDDDDHPAEAADESEDDDFAASETRPGDNPPECKQQ